METKRAKVIMLPTKDNTLIRYNSSLDIISSNITNFAVANNDYISCQHLYFTTDDGIKEGDWVYENNLNQDIRVYQIQKREGRLLFFRFRNVPIWLDKNNHNCKKIIATTDKSLLVNPHTKNRMLMYNILPHPSQAFIEKYCKVGGIDEVLVEYTQYKRFRNKIPNSCYEEGSFYIESLLKVDSYNTITIHPIKDSWSRGEVEDLIYLAMISRNHISLIEFNKWVEENL